MERWWNSVSVWRWLAGAALAACAGLGALLVLRPEPPGPAWMAVLSAPQDNSAGWIALVDVDRQLTLTPLHDTVVANRKALQLWLSAPDGGASVSLGLPEHDRQLKLSLGQLPPLQTGMRFAITLEPATGSPVPTGPVLYAGQTVKPQR
ncbi:anti-sigma factor domain-containing protein [Duganella sp. HH105]|uniref:anti-sigma factor domain-containing protein n=1 Tax=Duganella sp. HH105 TaxID=1781067 RepID=UPI000877CF76|nr:anti-sigma-K factor rskA [Duganella sp. HH105]